MTRMDWAVELYQWFNYYLKDIGEEPEPMVQIQTNDGKWHLENTWPPEDMAWNMQEIGTSWSITGTTVNAQGSSVTLVSEELTELTHIYWTANASFRCNYPSLSRRANIRYFV